MCADVRRCIQIVAASDVASVSPHQHALRALINKTSVGIRSIRGHPAGT